MTADGHHILGPAPAVKGFFFASGCKVAGLSISPSLGEALAAWILDGHPPIDLSPMSPARFSNKDWSEEQLGRDAAWQYRHSTVRFNISIGSDHGTNASSTTVLTAALGQMRRNQPEQI